MQPDNNNPKPTAASMIPIFPRYLILHFFHPDNDSTGSHEKRTRFIAIVHRWRNSWRNKRIGSKRQRSDKKHTRNGQEELPMSFQKQAGNPNGDQATQRLRDKNREQLRLPMAYDDIATNPQHDMHQQPMCRIKQKDEIKNQRGNLHRLHYHPHLQPSVSGQFPSE